jgi:hypothetical protein
MKELYFDIANELAQIDELKIIDLHRSDYSDVGSEAILPKATIKIQTSFEKQESSRIQRAKSRVTIRVIQENFADTNIQSPQFMQGLRIFDLVELVKATVLNMNFVAEKFLASEYLEDNQTNVYTYVLEFEFNYAVKIC